jgi:hypothetical protein
MSEIEFVKWAALALLGGFQWFIRNMITTTKDDIANLRKELDLVKQNYLHKDDFKEFKTELRSMFEEIKKDIRDLKKHEAD